MEEGIDRYRGLLTVFLVALVAAGALLWLLRRPEVRPLEITSPPQPTKPRERVVKVYVAGEVSNPGVYTLQDGDRVEDALKAAGGTTDRADRLRVNLAARVQDQQQILVPAIVYANEATGAGGDAQRSRAPSVPAAPARVNLNTASAADLDSLPGIGAVTVQKILNYREQAGPFRSVEELKDAKLVDKSQFEKIKDLVTAP